jgi:hypothetical protein
MSVNIPVVMVSSTFFDLRQIRADLAQFIAAELGYSPLLSEFSSFPIDPDVNTVENCRRRVERDADILILVLGGRYGYTDPISGKSVTNLEYLEAKAKGIPIYSFVEKSVLTALPIWERNPTADFSDIVADNRVFEFVRRVRVEDRVWMHEFELATDITTALRIQFAHLMREGLRLSIQLRAPLKTVPRGLRGKALRLALERPPTWEVRLFAQVLADGIEENAELRREHKLGISLGMEPHVAHDDMLNWYQARLDELKRTIIGITAVAQDSLQVALGPNGHPGDAEGLVFCARKLSEIYRNTLEWSQRLRRTYLPSCFRPVAIELSECSNDIIEKIENLGPLLVRSVDQALATPNAGIIQKVDLVLKLDISNQERLQAAYRQAEQDCFGR